MITPVMVLSLEAGLFTSVRVPSFTDETVLLPIPPKKPVPETTIVTGEIFEPVFVLSAVNVGAGVVTVNLSADTVALVPPKAATVISYVQGYWPEGITTPVIVLSLDAPPFERVILPSFTEVTVFAPIPPKKPVPDTVIVKDTRFEPALALKLVTAGAGVVTTYLSAKTVALVPPRAVTVMSYVPGILPEGITRPGMVLSFDAVMFDSASVPSFTNDTVLLPTPPKNPLPLTVTVFAVRFEPVFGVTPLTVTAPAVTMY